MMYGHGGEARGGTRGVWSLGVVVAASLAGCTAGSAPEDELPRTKAEAQSFASGGKTDWGFDICEHRGWYEDGVCDEFLFCDADPDCIHPLPEGSPTERPILLAHGFGGSRSTWDEVAPALRADGHEVFVAEVPAFAPPETRAEVLEGELVAALSQYDADRVHLIAHSQGGLDVRVLASPAGLDRGDSIASVTTVGTPHRGSLLADVTLGLIDGFSVPDWVLDAIARALQIPLQVLTEDIDEPDLRGAIAAFAVANADQWSEGALPDAPGISYQSWAGVASPFGEADSAMRDSVVRACSGRVQINEDDYAELLWFELPTWPIVGGVLAPFEDVGVEGSIEVRRWARERFEEIGPFFDEIEPNDGVVPVSSTRWGTFRGCVPSEHIDLHGFEGFDPDSGFHPVRFYRNIAFGLAEASGTGTPGETD